MIQTLKKLTTKSTASLAMLGLMFGGFAMHSSGVNAQAIPEDTHTVTITKFVEGERATTENAQGLSFPMMSSWAQPSQTPGSGTYALDAGNNYQAMTAEMAEGSSYSTNEDVSGENVDATCTEGGAPYALIGYTTGNTYEEAAAGTPSPTAPAFTNLTQDKFVIVWNDDCSIPNEPEMVHVTILKYVDGEPATASSTQSTGFDMVSSSTNPEGAPAGGGSYELNPGNDYMAMTNPMEEGSSYTTYEVVDDETVAMSCTEDGAPYAFQGYTSGSSIEEAENGTMATTSSITLQNIQEDTFIIVWNETCDGEAVPGEGELTVDSVNALDTDGQATGNYADGWSYRFNLTVPTDEQNVAFRFANWMSGNDMLPVANNMRISSEQADNNGATVSITAANVYSADLRMVEDLNPLLPGLQVAVLVEVRIPSGTNNGSYITSYGIRSTPVVAQ